MSAAGTSDGDDPLGDGFVAQTLALKPDREGEALATLVHRDGPSASTRALLYIHGFVDYVFQRHLAEAVEAAGFAFYGLDLRSYGRSLRPNRTFNFITDLAIHDEEIDAARAILRTRGHDRPVLMGHSTGGLTAALYAHRHAGALSGLLLNSPWLDLQGTDIERGPLTWLIDKIGALFPKQPVAQLSPIYARSLHRTTGGAWDFDTTWKPLDPVPVRAGFLRAVRRGHAQVAAGLAIDCPVLVCCSDRSGPRNRTHPDLLSTDSVLDVEQIVARAPLLGTHVEVRRIAGGIHDLALSAEPARSAYLTTVRTWLSDLPH
jgi:alpha-beta hydrolase superfamily lysophospholipase